MDVKHEDALSRACQLLRQSAEPLMAAHSVASMFEDLLRYERYCFVLMRESDLKPAVFAHSMREIKESERKDELIRVNEIISDHKIGVINHVIKSGDSMIVPETADCDLYAEGSPISKSEACVPMIVRGRTIGAFNVESRYCNFFNASDSLILNCVANQLALLIDASKVLQSFDGSNFDEICGN